VIPFFQASIKKFDFMVGVPLQDRRTISQLLGIICENAVVFGAVSPSAGRVDHGITISVDSNGVTNGNFHRFPLLGVRCFCYRIIGVDGFLFRLFSRNRKRVHLVERV